MSPLVTLCWCIGLDLNMQKVSVLEFLMSSTTESGGYTSKLCDSSSSTLPGTYSFSSPRSNRLSFLVLGRLSCSTNMQVGWLVGLT